MKTISTFLLTLCLLSCGSIYAQSSTATAMAATAEVNAISWDTETYQFGTVEQNIPVTAEFVLTNNGEKPIVITEVKKTCGCTVPAYDEAPIMPGESSIIKATYNAKKEGSFTKTIKVYTTLSDQPIPLKLKGTVSKKGIIAGKKEKL